MSLQIDLMTQTGKHFDLRKMTIASDISQPSVYKCFVSIAGSTFLLLDETHTHTEYPLLVLWSFLQHHEAETS